MNRSSENNLPQNLNVTLALKDRVGLRKRRQLPTVAALYCGLFILLVVIASPLLTVSSASSNSVTPLRTNAPTPGTVRARARAIFSTTTTETFTMTVQVFTGSTDCTSGGGAITTVNNQGQAPYDLTLGPADSVLFIASHLSDQSNEVVVGDSSGSFIDWLIPTGQTPGGITVPPATQRQICVQGLDSPNIREVDASYRPALQLRDPTCTTQLTAFHPGDTICITVFGGRVDAPAPQHLFGKGGTSSSSTECTFLPIPPTYTPVDVTADVYTYLYTFPASNAAIPTACATLGNTTDIRGPWRFIVSTPDNTGVSAIKTLELTDPVSCSLSCPGDVNVSNDTDECSAVVTYTTPSGSGCGTVTCDHPSGSAFPVGTTLVTCTSSTGPTCTFHVTVNDTQNPTITAPAGFTVGTDSNSCVATGVTLGTPVTGDNCSVLSVGNDAPATFPLGPTTVTWTVTDTHGHSATAPQVINVVDNTPPSLNVPAGSSASANLSCQAAIPNVVAGSTASDNCGSVTVTQSPAAGTLVGLGAHTITVTATDTAGNHTDKPVTFTVVDTTAPVITLNGNVITLWPPDHTYHTVQVTDLVAMAVDNCDAGVNLNSVYISQVTSDESEDGNGDGNTSHDIVIAADCKSVQLRAERQGGNNGRVYTITFKVRDASGNTATATAAVTVPESQNGAAAVDDGPIYTVLSGCP